MSMQLYTSYHFCIKLVVQCTSCILLLKLSSALFYSEYGNMDWDSNNVIAVNGFLRVYTTFSFIVSFIVAMNAMAIIKPISIKLQSVYYDIVKAYTEVTAVIDELAKFRDNDAMLHSWYVQAEKFAEELNVAPQVPRTTSRQRHCDNVEHDSVKEYYRRSIEGAV